MSTKKQLKRVKNYDDIRSRILDRSNYKGTNNFLERNIEETIKFMSTYRKHYCAKNEAKKVMRKLDKRKALQMLIEEHLRQLF